METTLGDLIDQMLNGIIVKYGNHSREYEMAGGTRKSDRLRRSAESRAKNPLPKSAPPKSESMALMAEAALN
jgi:hypothetical protein